MPTLDQVSAGASAITQINANEQSLQVAAAYGRRASTSSGLTLGYYGATLQDGTVIAAGTVTVGASTTTYVVVNRSTGAVSSATSTTNWNDTTNYMRMAQVVSNGSGITAYTDARPVGGLSAGGGGGSGTVTSVGLSVDAALGDVFSVSGSPVTSSGTLELEVVDPGADRLVMWDDSAGELTYATLGTNLSFSGTTLNASGGGGGSSSFIGLTDVPASYSGASGKYTKVNVGETALVFRGGLNAQTGTTYTTVAADEDALVTMTNAASNVLTIPPNASVAYPIGASIAVQQGGAGATSIAAGAGVTIVQPAGLSLVLSSQYSTAVAVKTATNTWTLTGELAPSLPVFAARAWVNFNGTGTVAIRASGNVSSITDNGVGDYTVNYTTALPDANGAVLVTGTNASANNFNTAAPTTTSARIQTFSSAGAAQDQAYISVVVMR